jgi:tetratricopeptide (TPR) repeat protein
MAASVVLLRALLVQRRWHRYRAFIRAYDEAARVVDASLVGCGPSEPQFERWLAGKLKTLPRPDHCRVLEAMLAGHTAEELFAPAPAVLPSPTVPGPGDGEPCEAVTAEASSIRAGSLQVPDTEASAGGTAGVGRPVTLGRGEPGGGRGGDPPGEGEIEEIVMVTADESAAFGSWAEITNVGDFQLEHLQTRLRHVARTVYHSPLEKFLDAARLRNVAFALLDGRQRPDQTRDLYLIASLACVILAWESADLGRHDAADTQARTAWLCAELAGHDGARAWVRVAQAANAYWRGEVTEAAQRAEAALEYARRGTVGVLAACQAADWARLGDNDQAESLLRRVDTEYERPADPDEPGGLLGCDRERQLGFTGSTYLRLGQPQEALTEFDQARDILEGAPEEEFRYGLDALVRLDAAKAHLALDHLDGAEEMIDPVLALPVERRVDSIIQRLDGVNAMLSADRYRQSHTGQALRDRIDDFRTLTGRLLPP